MNAPPPLVGEAGRGERTRSAGPSPTLPASGKGVLMWSSDFGHPKERSTLQMTEVFKMTRKSYTTDFKREAASLVLDQGYSVRTACEAMDVGHTAMRRWVNQLRQEREGITPEKSKALTPEQQRIQELEARLRKVEREKEILKKATALLMSDSLGNAS